MSAISSIALQSIHSGLERAARHSEQIISAFSSGDQEPTQPIVALAQDQRAVRVSAKLIRVDQELDRAVLDILA